MADEDWTFFEYDRDEGRMGCNPLVAVVYFTALAALVVASWACLAVLVGLAVRIWGWAT